jgi:hypothetical protein
MIEYGLKRANSGIYVPYRELPAWREKMIKPAWQEKSGLAIKLSLYRPYTGCVTVIKHSINSNRIKLTDEPKDKNDMQV